MLIINRFLLFVYAFIVGFFALFLILLGLDALEVTVVGDPEKILEAKESVTALGIFAGISLYFMLWSVFCGKQKKAPKKESVISFKGETGDTLVTTEAIRALAERETLESLAVKTVRVEVEPQSGEGVAPFSLKLRLGILEGANVQTVADAVKANLEESFVRTLNAKGVPVAITVDNVTQPQENKRRVA